MTAPLFRQYGLRDVFEAREREISQKINSLAEERILNSSHLDLCRYFVETYTIDGVEIDEEGIEVDYGDARVDVGHRPDYFVRDRSRPAMVDGTRIAFFVPFVGSEQLLQCRPSTYALDGGIDALCRDGNLVFIYDRTRQDASKIGDEFQRDLERLRTYLRRVAGEVHQHNAALEDLVEQCITSRREKLLNDRGLVESLGFPLKRSDAPTTYSTPDVRRRIAPRLPSVSKESYQPEPALEMAEYEHIMSIVSNMVVVMERSPQAFRGMSEENLRQHFLVHLNGHYEGQATGETFNFEGKTDILIRAKNKNVFIAECKFWTGPSGLTDAVDQLLSYTSWRDTKTTLLIFNRDRKVSTVLEKIPDAVKSHTNFKNAVTCDLEAGFRFILGHRDDPNREVILTVLAFDVPA